MLVSCSCDAAQMCRTETSYNGLEGFPKHTQNSGDIPDVQDGYGLMTSELLGNDFSSRSSIPQDINSINNAIDLHNGELLAVTSVIKLFIHRLSVY